MMVDLNLKSFVMVTHNNIIPMLCIARVLCTHNYCVNMISYYYRRWRELQTFYICVNIYDFEFLVSEIGNKLFTDKISSVLSALCRINEKYSEVSKINRNKTFMEYHHYRRILLCDTPAVINRLRKKLLGM